MQGATWMPNPSLSGRQLPSARSTGQCEALLTKPSRLPSRCGEEEGSWQQTHLSEGATRECTGEEPLGLGTKMLGLGTSSSRRNRTAWLWVPGPNHGLL